MLSFQYIYIYIYTENGTNGKWLLPFVAANGKQKFDFFGRQTINGNRRFLYICTYTVC